MGGDHHVEPGDPLRLEIVDDGRAFPDFSCVDQHILFRGLDQLTVRLPHVDEMDQQVALRLGWNGGKASLIV